ncbi:MAG: rhomboid family intramembrane serine protease, partial [Bacteroidales bacterium]|nr:rhomboid family intramembrane serine protease [Bacteroidales bacterium]
MAATEKTSPDSGFPTPHDVLKWCAETHPKIWFPSEYAQDTGMPREQINEPLWILRQAGLVKVVDWVRGKGQGFTLTPAGEVALTEPGLIPTTLPPSATVTHDVPSAIPPTSGETIPDVPSRTATTFERGEQAREAVYGRRRTLVTPILIAFNVAWFLLGGIAAWRMGVSSSEYLQGESSEVLLRIGAVSGLSLLDGQWWRLLSSGWVHIGILHLLANMIGLMILGPMAEMMWGRPRFLLIYLLSGLSASCLAMALEPNAVLAGASGSIWGMMTAITVWVVRVRSHLPPSAEMQSLFRGLMTVLLINFVASAAPGVSWQGHFGGGLAGIIMAFLMEPLRGRYRTPLH